MCRVLAYLGQPVLLDDLLYKADNSLVRQTYDPKMLHMLNLAGFGVVAWDPTSHEPETPFIYRTTSLPVFDSNLRRLALKMRPTCVVAHVRGVPYSELQTIAPQNIHPFRFDGFRLAMAHNGQLEHFSEMRFDLLEFIRPEIARLIQGTTDSEWIYALIMSQVDDPSGDLRTEEIARATAKALSILRKVRDRLGIKTSSPVNLFLTDGNDLVATRFTFDFGCYEGSVVHDGLPFLSLWYTFGRQYGWHDDEWKMIGGIGSYDSIIVASEPLTDDVSTWLEVPEYGMLSFSLTGEKRRIATTAQLDV